MHCAFVTCVYIREKDYLLLHLSKYLVHSKSHWLWQLPQTVCFLDCIKPESVVTVYVLECSLKFNIC